LVLALLFGLSLVSNVYFLGGFSNFSSVCRAALTVALIEHGSTSIDALADLTGDKADRDGHYYCDKAPGTSFLAIPVAAAFIAVVNPRGDDALWQDDGKISVAFGALIAVSAALTVALLTALSVALLCDIVQRLGASLGCAVAIALIDGNGTPVWLWATGLFGHSAAAALLVMGFHALLKAAENGKREGWWALWCGIALGWAVLMEFTAAVPVSMLLIFALLQSPSPGAHWRRLGLIVLGGIPELGLLLAYNGAAFGSPVELGYSHTSLFDGMQTGFFGLGLPSLSVLWEITLGNRRGLLCLSPVLALFPLGAVYAVVSARWRILGALWVLIVAYYFLLNSGYVYWDGGFSTGPRHVTAGLPFACLVLAPLWERGGLLARRAIVTLGAVSGVLCLIAVSVDTAMPDDPALTIAGYLLPRFWQGPFNGGLAFVLHNLGWPGVTPVLPFLPLWGLMAAALLRQVRDASPRSFGA
jgi:hypothetical protein